MTENEAREILNGIDEVRGELPEDGNDVEIALMMAKDALEEIQQYRALEQKLQSVYGEHNGLLEIIVNGLVKYEKAPDTTPDKSILLTDDDVDRWEQYKAIGTMEEYQTAVEKMKPKKLTDDGARVPFSYYCPTCNQELSDGGYKYDENHCFNCGQAIKQSE